MDFTDFTAGQDDDGRRLDRILRRLMRTDGLSGLYRAVRKGLVRVNGGRASPEQRIRAGDRITAASFLVPAGETAPRRFPYEILFRNGHLLIVNKPYDRTVHGFQDSLDRAAAAFYSLEAGAERSLSFAPGPLHRLDRKTTGALVFSWSLKGAQWFSRSLAAGAIRKTYLGIAEGHLPEKTRWEDKIARGEPFQDGGQGASARQDGGGKPHSGAAPSEGGRRGFFRTVAVKGAGAEASAAADSESAAAADAARNPAEARIPAPRADGDGRGLLRASTCAEPVAYGTDGDTEYTLVRYQIGTGRKHQIRAQSAAHGFPLLGDTAYGGRVLSAPQDFFLHALSLAFPADNPVGLPPIVTAPLPEAFSAFLRRTLDGGTLLNEDMKFIIGERL